MSAEQARCRRPAWVRVPGDAATRLPRSASSRRAPYTWDKIVDLIEGPATEAAPGRERRRDEPDDADVTATETALERLLAGQTGVAYTTLRKHYGKILPSHVTSQLERFATIAPTLFHTRSRGQSVTQKKCEEGT